MTPRLSGEAHGWGLLAKAQSRSPCHVWMAEEGLHPWSFLLAGCACSRHRGVFLAIYLC